MVAYDVANVNELSSILTYRTMEGTLLFTNHGIFFRVYCKKGKMKYKDYEVKVDDLPITIRGGYYSLDEKKMVLKYKGFSRE